MAFPQLTSICNYKEILVLISQNAAHLAPFNFRSCRFISRKLPPPGKPPICPPAKRVLYGVVHRPWMDPADVKELLWRRHAYNNAMISLRKFFKEESANSTYEDIINKEVQEERAEFERLLAENDERNRKAAEAREKREEAELREMEIEYLKSIEKELQRREVNAKQKMEEVLEMVERSKHFVTEDNLDQKLEEAIENPVVYDFAVDLQGNKYYAPLPEKYVKGIPPHQSGRMYDVTLGTELYSRIEPFSIDSGESGRKEESRNQQQN